MQRFWQPWNPRQEKETRRKKKTVVKTSRLHVSTLHISVSGQGNTVGSRDFVAGQLRQEELPVNDHLTRCGPSQLMLNRV